MKVTSSHYLKCLLLGLAAVMLMTNTSQAWWNDEWSLRRKITIDTSDKGGGISDPIGTTPVLIRLHDGNFQFTGAKEDGSDLRFVAADEKTLLTYHVEKWDPLLGEAFVWVKVPDVKPGAQTVLWLYYGNTGSKATRVDNANETYDGDTILVYHFAEQGQPANDSTTYNNHAEKAGVTAQGSQIGGGLRFDGRSAITIPASSALAWANEAAITWSAWIKPAALQPNAIVFSRREEGRALLIGIANGIPFVEMSSETTGALRTPAGAALQPGAWRHIAIVVTDSTVTLFLDGEIYATLSAKLPSFNTPLLLGGDTDPASADAAAVVNGFAGELDELELSKSARPGGFIKLAAFGQGGEKAAKLLAFGEEEQPSNWLSGLSTGYFGVIFKSLSVDGWIVICLLAVMSVISWFVMISKISYLNGVSNGNALFMKEWNHIANDLTVLDDVEAEKSKSMGGRIDKAGQKALGSSSVYRIYKIGVEEIRHRLAADLNAGTRKGLSGRSIQAIRASLDGGLVRETQKINRLIVLLTICISGGPFLGLLGTVVGVMITFAAVAAAGDVNVNAIAPGIAAALLATVAGLAVAIPALFGYNYILSRVKDATSDMHVFIDEFVTKMAEFYRERTEQPWR